MTLVPISDAPPNGNTAVARLDTPLGTINARWESLERETLATSATSASATSSGQDGILKCLNVQYADIPYRWAAPRKRPSIPWQGTRDCTAFGPGCPQIGRPTLHVGGVPMFGPVGQDSAGNATLPHRPQQEDEFACLNLNIYAPGTKSGETAHTSTTHLPVLVWVYGGAYQVGSGSVDAYDGSPLVRRGLAIGKPTVVVTINYRVGVLGFLHSRQLAASAATQLDVPPTFRSTANLGLVDCKYAFDWLKENIQHFGGDPRNITAMGESAGAGAIHHMMTVPQLYINVPRIILSSSTCMSIQLQRADEAQRSFDSICRKLGVEETPGGEIKGPTVIEQLRGVPVDKLVEETWFMSSAYRPTWDDITITADPREVTLQPHLWNPSLRSIIMGTCQNEPWLREAAIIANKRTHNINTLIPSRIPPVDALRQRAAQIYGNDPNSFPWYTPSAELAVPAHNRCAMALEGHCRYNTPAILFSRSFLASACKTGEGETPRRTLYRYVFGYATAHWPAHWPVTHTADILPTFLHSSLNDADLRVAETFVDQLLQFTGGDPTSWQEYTVDANLLNVLGRDGSWSVADEAEGAVFDLNEERVQFWADVLKTILATGRTGWAEMAR